MNIWKCDREGCGRQIAGVGSAVGVRAVGWYFALGPVIFCPDHRPDTVPCVEEGKTSEGPCSYCAAAREARRIQRAIERNFDGECLNVF